MLNLDFDSYVLIKTNNTERKLPLIALNKKITHTRTHTHNNYRVSNLEAQKLKAHTHIT